MSIMKNESYTVFDGDFHAHIEEKYLQQQHFVCRTLENIKELDAWRQGTMSSNLRMCTDLFSNKLDTLVREHVGFAHDLWSLMNWSNPGSDLLSKIGDLHEEHRDIIDECIEELLPRLITVLSATEEQLLGPMRSSEIITGDELLELANQCSTGRSLFRSEIDNIEIDLDSRSEQPSWILDYSVFGPEAQNLLNAINLESYTQQRDVVYAWMRDVCRSSPFAQFELQTSRAIPVINRCQEYEKRQRRGL